MYLESNKPCSSTGWGLSYCHGLAPTANKGPPPLRQLGWGGE